MNCSTEKYQTLALFGKGLSARLGVGESVMYHSESNQYRDSKWRKLLMKYIYDRLVRHIKREIGNRKTGL